MGSKLLKFAIFDRDYRSSAEAAHIPRSAEVCWLAVVHEHKEIENFLLQPVHLRARSARSWQLAAGKLKLIDAAAAKPFSSSCPNRLRTKCSHSSSPHPAVRATAAIRLARQQHFRVGDERL
jgi:hypothetical protein